MFVFVGAASLLFAEEEAGFLVQFEGQVFVESKGKKVEKVMQNMPLLEGDKIVTKSKSSATVMLEDKSVIEMQANAVLVISQLQKKKGKTKESFFVKSGKAIFSFFKRKGRSTTVETPTALAGIKSTELAVEAEEDVASIAVLDGEIDVVHKGTNKKERLKKDEELEVPRRGKMRRRKILKLLWAKRRMPKFREKVKRHLKRHPELLKRWQGWKAELKRRGIKDWRQLRKEKIKKFIQKEKQKRGKHYKKEHREREKHYKKKQREHRHRRKRQRGR